MPLHRRSPLVSGSVYSFRALTRLVGCQEGHMSESKNLCHLLLKVFDWNNWKKKTTGGGRAAKPAGGER